MKYPNNDLWSVREIQFLQDALKGYQNKDAIYYPGKALTLDIPEVGAYNYVGVLHFPEQDRTIIFEQGQGFGLQKTIIINYLREKNIQFEEK